MQGKGIKSLFSRLIDSSFPAFVIALGFNGVRGRGPFCIMSMDPSSTLLTLKPKQPEYIDIIDLSMMRPTYQYIL